MKKLIFKEILLISYKEKRARRISFHEKRTIILGPNTTGKSSLIKSIYYAFGAEPQKVTKAWKDLNPVISVNFLIDEENYYIMRMDNIFTIFDKNQKKIFSGKSVTNELGPFIANLLDYKIKIVNRSGISVTPPPQYLFLSYYMDQDSSWTNPWEGFSGLGQFSDWKDNIVSYATGIKPNRYYELMDELNINENKLKDVKSQEQVLNNTLETIQNGLENVNFEIDSEIFKSEIDQLTSKTNELHTFQNKIRQKLVEHHNFRSSIIEQIEITKNAIKEISSDYKYALEKLTAEHIECPTCGTLHNNSFTERFEIARDENKCRELLITLKKELSEVEEKISEQKKKYDDQYLKIEEIKEILQTKKQGLELQDILKLEGRKEIKSMVHQNLEKNIIMIQQFDDLITSIKKEISEIDDKKRVEKIKNMYREYMGSNLSSLDIGNIPEESLEKITGNFKFTGSELPRSLLAYYFAILKLMRNFSSSAFCPLIIDSPNQQDLDKLNIPRVFTFIIDSQPENSQLILGLTDTHGVDFGGKTIVLDKKYQLLQTEEYNEVDQLLRVQFNQVIG